MKKAAGIFQISFLALAVFWAVQTQSIIGTISRMTSPLALFLLIGAVLCSWRARSAKKVAAVLVIGMFACTGAFAHKKTIVKVTVPMGTEDRAVQSRGAGVLGLIHGTKTDDRVFMLNVSIDGEHARLKCYESHKGCSPLGAGDYEGELDKDSIWITQQIPLTHKMQRDHWKVVGSW
jgi:hypothetical protein